MRGWIAAPDPPDAGAVAELCEQLRQVARISEAWVVGSRMTPDDGAPSRETTDLALVLDPPLSDQPDETRMEISAVWTELDERVHWSRPGRGLLLVSAAQIRHHEPRAVQIYSRARPSA
jgi:hypothetical protein